MPDKIMTHAELSRLLDSGEVETAYWLVPMIVGDDAVPIGEYISNILHRMKQEDRSEAARFYVSHDVEDKSVYIGKCPNATYEGLEAGL